MMSFIKQTTFEDFLYESFSDGIYSRELRLSDSEVNFMKEKFPNMKIETLADPKNRSLQEDENKKWYKVSIASKKPNNNVEEKTKDIEMVKN